MQICLSDGIIKKENNYRMELQFAIFKPRPIKTNSRILDAEGDPTNLLSTTLTTPFFPYTGERR